MISRQDPLTPQEGCTDNSAPDVVMYCTRWCPYCIRADRLLESKGVTTVSRVRVDLEPDKRQEMQQRSGRHTVPQIFIHGRHVGGYDDLAALDRAGELDLLLAGKSKR
jgi:glutaredoxin 3